MEKLNAIKEKIYAACPDKDFATYKYGKPVEVKPELADVLRAIDETEMRKEIRVETSGLIYYDDGENYDDTEWNLALPLDEQEPAVIEFLHKILCHD